MKRQPTPVFLPEKFRGQRSLVSHSPWSHREADMTEYEHEGMRAGVYGADSIELCTKTHGAVPGLGSLLNEYPFLNRWPMAGLV